MSKPPTCRVSVVIVSWNAKAYLRECLESLNEHVYNGAMEIVVVDNASDDGSAEMVSQYFPEVKLACNENNLGFAKANNIGIRLCTGEYIALINSDVHVLKDCITTLVAYCDSHPSVGMAGPFIIGSDGEQQFSCRSAPSLWNMFCRAIALDILFPNSKYFNGYFLGHWDHSSVAHVDILSGCFWLARRAALDEVGLLDESFFIYGEDMDWCKRYRDKGWGVVFVPSAKAIHYGGASSNNAPLRFFVEKQKADSQYWHKHHSHFAAAVYSVIAGFHHIVRITGYSLNSIIRPHKRATSWYKVKRSAACVRLLAKQNENP